MVSNMLRQKLTRSPMLTSTLLALAGTVVAKQAAAQDEAAAPHSPEDAAAGDGPEQAGAPAEQATPAAAQAGSETAEVASAGAVASAAVTVSAQWFGPGNALFVGSFNGEHVADGSFTPWGGDQAAGSVWGEFMPVGFQPNMPNFSVLSRSQLDLPPLLGNPAGAFAGFGAHFPTWFFTSGPSGGTFTPPLVTESQLSWGTLITGTAWGDSILHGGDTLATRVFAMGGNDIINTGSGADIIRGGDGADRVQAGDGNDVIVLIGQTGANQYSLSDITNPGRSGIDLSSVLSLESLNGRAVSEVSAGEVIDGGAGNNRLVIYGNVDLTGVTLNNISQFQVNSTVTISAQQLQALNTVRLVGDGDSVLYITNDGSGSSVLDLSDVALSNFRSLDIAEGVTIIADQADIASLRFISGAGTLRASSESGTLDLSGKYVSVIVEDKDGAGDSAKGGGIVVTGKVVIGSEGDDVLAGTALGDRLEGGDGNDRLQGGAGDDVLRGGKGVDYMDGGAGDDVFVVVGDLSGGGKVDSDEDTAALGQPLTDLNGLNLDEDESGGAETVIGGDGDDTLYVYGTADLSNFTITGIEHVEIRSDVTFSEDFFKHNTIQSMAGDGSSVLRIESTSPLVLDLTALGAITLDKIGQISLGPNVTLKVSSIDDLGGARILTGEGKIQATSGSLNLSGFTKTSTLTVNNADGSSSSGAEVLDHVVSTKVDGVITGTSGDDYLTGTATNDIMDSKGGNDLMSGKDGNDTFKITGAGTKTIIDAAGKDTIDLSGETGGAEFNLSSGGTAGAAQVVIGSGSGKLPLDLFMIEDLSGSFGDDVATVNGLLDGLISNIRAFQPNSTFGAGSFVDKPTYPFGDAGWGDYVYRTDSKLSSDASQMKAAFAAMTIHSGYDGPEAQLEALYQVALRAIRDDASSTTGGDEIGFRSGSARVVVLATDADFHREGDYEGVPNNDGDTVLDGSPPGSGEDYPTIAQVRDALVKANIIPVFAVAGGYTGTYESLVSELGRGDVVSLSSNSSDLVNAVTSGLTHYTLDFIENVVGTNYADELTGNVLDNVITGGGGDDVMKGMAGADTYYGGSGEDTVVFNGNFSDYQVVLHGAGLQVTDLHDSKNVDFIYNDVECIQFDDVKKPTMFSSSGGNVNHLNFTMKDVSYLSGSSYSGLVFDQTLTFGLGALGDTINIDGFSLGSEYTQLMDFDLQRDYPGVYDTVSKLDWMFDPTTYVKANAWLNFTDMSIDLNNSFINVPIYAELKPGNFDLNYNVVMQLDGRAEDGHLQLSTKTISSSQATDFSSLIEDFSVKVDIRPDLDITGGKISAGVKLDADAPGLDPIHESYTFDGSLDGLNREYSLIDVSLLDVLKVADDEIEDQAASFSGKEGYYGRYDSKGTPFTFDVNVPDFASVTDKGAMTISYPETAAIGGLVDVNASFNAWKPGSDLFQAGLDIDDIIGLVVKPMSFSDLHVNFANITARDYSNSSSAGKAIFDMLAKIDKFGEVYADSHFTDGDSIASSAWDAYNAAKSVSAASGLNLGSFTIPFQQNANDFSLEFDATLFGLDVNVGLSPVLTFTLDAQSVDFDMRITSPDDPSYVKRVFGTVGDEISIPLPEGISHVVIDAGYDLNMVLRPKVELAYNIGLDMRAFGLDGNVMGYEIPDLPKNLIDFGDFGSDATYLLHLPQDGSDNEHYRYDLFSGTIPLADLAAINLDGVHVEETNYLTV